MDVKILRIAQLLAGAELISALLLPGAYLFPFRYGFRADNWHHPALILSALLSVLLVAVPAATLAGLLRRRVGAFWGLYASPVISFIFGVGSLPFVARLAPAGVPRAVLLGAINLGAIGVALWLRARLRRGSKRAVAIQPHLQ
jgi:hypothetical protein